jgi:hypothetical protein
MNMGTLRLEPTVASEGFRGGTCRFRSDETTVSNVDLVDSTTTEEQQIGAPVGGRTLHVAKRRGGQRVGG